MRANWVTPISITEDGYYPLQAAEASEQVYQISTNFGVNEFLLIENRQPILWDSDMEGGGIVIYHVDEMKWDQSTRGYPGHPNWPSDHYMVSVIQADGLYQIEKGESPGDQGDFWTMGMKLKKDGDMPNTNSINTGALVSTGITIEVVTISQFIMMIHVTGISATAISRSGNNTAGAFVPDTLQTYGVTETQDIEDPKSTYYTTEWILSMLGGSAVLVGFVALVL